MNVTLTDPAHIAALKDARPGDTVHLVVAGDWDHDDSVGLHGTPILVPPAEWQQASEPCPTCDGEGATYCDGCGGHLCPNPLCGDAGCPNPHYCPDDCDGTSPPCPDCINGKQRVTLMVLDRSLYFGEDRFLPLATATVEAVANASEDAWMVTLSIVSAP